MAGWEAAEIANLGDELDGLDATIVQNEIMIAAENISVIPELVRKINFAGVGLALKQPYMNATEWSTTPLAEGAQMDQADIDVEDATSTIVKYTVDWPISLEAESYGAANAVQSAILDAGRGFSKLVSGLIHGKINDETDLDVTSTTALEPADLVLAKQKMITNAVPGPHCLVLHAEHWTDILAGSSVTLTGLSNPEPFTSKMDSGYVGNYAGFETFICPYAVGTGVGASGTAAMSVFFSKSDGVRYVWKPTKLPAPASNGPMGVRIWWSDEWRSWCISGTHFGVGQVVRAAESNPWCGNLYLSA